MPSLSFNFVNARASIPLPPPKYLYPRFSLPYNPHKVSRSIASATIFFHSLERIARNTSAALHLYTRAHTYIERVVCQARGYPVVSRRKQKTSRVSASRCAGLVSPVYIPSHVASLATYTHTHTHAAFNFVSELVVLSSSVYTIHL